MAGEPLISGRQGTGLVVSVPHAGVWVPPEVAAQLAVSPERARPEVDEYTLELAQAAEPWATVVVNRVARLVIDVNRSGSVSAVDLEGDREGERERLVRLYTATGLPRWRRQVGQPCLTRREVERRLRRYHEPYHRALQRSLDAAPRPRALVDVHSVSWPAFDAIVGDFRGRSAGAPLCEKRLVPFLDSQGLKVAYAGPRDVDAGGRPVPWDAVRYSGGFITARYGNPAAGQYALQVEVSRQTCGHRLGEVQRAFGAFFQFLAEEVLGQSRRQPGKGWE